MPTVKELIEKLQTFDQDQYVLIPGYEGGYQDIDLEKISEEKMVENHYDRDQWYYGRHEIATMNDHPDFKAVIIK